MAESSKSRARRLRGTLTKQQLYQQSEEKETDKQKVDRLIDTVNNLVIMLQGCTIHCPYAPLDASGDSNCWGPFCGLPGTNSCDPHCTEAIPEHCPDSSGSLGPPEDNHFSCVTPSHLRTDSVSSDDSEAESSLPDWVAEHKVTQKMTCAQFLAANVANLRRHAYANGR
jgi:hypothetical protein